MTYLQVGVLEQFGYPFPSCRNITVLGFTAIDTLGRETIWRDILRDIRVLQRPYNAGLLDEEVIQDQQFTPDWGNPHPEKSDLFRTGTVVVEFRPSFGSACEPIFVNIETTKHVGHKIED